jgi:hypothetical protein
MAPSSSPNTPSASCFNVAGHELPAKILDYRALLYLLRSKQGKSKKKSEGKKETAAAAAATLSSKERMSPEEKLLMSMLKEESGVDALDRTMVRVGVDIEKVMERVQNIAGGEKDLVLGASETADFEPEHGELEKPVLSEPLPVLSEDDGAVRSLYDKGWGTADNFVIVDGTSEWHNMTGT